MKSLMWDDVHAQGGSPSSGSSGHAPGRRSGRLTARLLAFGAAAALAVALMPAAATAAPVRPHVVAAIPSGDWTQFHNGPTREGNNTQETTLSASNVSDLRLAWTGTSGNTFWSSPAVANGVVYVGSEDGKLYAFAVGCARGGGSCPPLWTGTTGGAIFASPAVSNGVVYIGSADGKLYAFDAAGLIGCSGSPKTCSPLWTSVATGGVISGSPAVVNGVVYDGSADGKLYAFDAAGVTGCSGSPKTCNPLWTGASGGLFDTSAPAVANGVVYIGSDDHKLYAFDAAGVTGCSGSPKTCTPLWTADTGGGIYSSPAVANGVVYVGSADGKLYAFDAAGATGCSGSPKTCTPLWTAATGGIDTSSPAVANGVVYVGSTDHGFYAFDAAGVTGCSGSPKTCAPLWTATTGGVIQSSPAVANGVVYVGSSDNKLYAFDAAGVTGCSGSPKTCAPLWTFTTGSQVRSSPAVANGVVYVGSNDFKMYAFDLASTYHALTPTRLLDSRNGTGLSGVFISHVARTFQVTGVVAPLDATAVTGNLTVTGQTSLGFLYMGPKPMNNPTSSTLNFPVGDDRANAVTVTLGSGGTLSVTYAAPTPGPTAHVVFDITGYFTPDDTGATYHALTPTRILDSRDGTGGLGVFSSHVAQTFGVRGVGGVPANAVAVTGNLTVTSQTSLGFLYMGPNAANNPTSSTLNFPVGDDRANAVTVALSGTGTLSVTYAAPTTGPTAHVIFDVTGYFTPDMTGATYHALSPTRILDSRNGTGGLGVFSSHVAQTFWVAGTGGVPFSAIAVTGNLTVTQQTSLGFLYMGPNAANNPTSSTLNFPLKDDRANAVTVALSGTGTLSVTYAAPTSGPTAQVIFDVGGYFEP